MGVGKPGMRCALGDRSLSVGAGEAANIVGFARRNNAPAAQASASWIELSLAKVRILPLKVSGFRIGERPWDFIEEVSSLLHFGTHWL